MDTVGIYEANVLKDDHGRPNAKPGVLKLAILSNTDSPGIGATLSVGE
jgi:hypothetical protein